MANIKTLQQTKFKLSILALTIAITGFLLVNFMPGLATVYTTLISAILGILTIYSGGNLGQDYLARKHGPLPHEVPALPDADPVDDKKKDDAPSNIP